MQKSCNCNNFKSFHPNNLGPKTTYFAKYCKTGTRSETLTKSSTNNSEISSNKTEPLMATIILILKFLLILIIPIFYQVELTFSKSTRGRWAWNGISVMSCWHASVLTVLVQRCVACALKLVCSPSESAGRWLPRKTSLPPYRRWLRHMPSSRQRLSTWRTIKTLYLILVIWSMPSNINSPVILVIYLINYHLHYYYYYTACHFAALGYYYTQLVRVLVWNVYDINGIICHLFILSSTLKLSWRACGKYQWCVWWYCTYK